MADTIKVSAEQLRTIANSFAKKAEQLEQMKSEMTNLNNQLEGAWQGDAARNYLDDYKVNFEPNMVKAVANIRAVSDNIKAVADTYATAESAVANAFK